MKLEQQVADEALSLETRVRQAQLTPAQRQVARLLLERSDHFMFLSAADVAAESGVSQPSVSRLAKALGYASFSEMSLAVRLRAQGARLGDTSADQANHYQQAIDDEIALLQAMRRSLADDQAIHRAARIIHAANVVVVMGLRISVSLAQNAVYRLGRMRPHVLLSTSDGSQGYDDLALTSAPDRSVLLVFAMPRYPRELVGLIEYAKKRGYAVVVVTDTQANELAGLADVALIAQINWGLTFGTHTAATVLTALLAEAVGALQPEEMGRRLSSLDEVASEMGHYLID